MSPLTLGEIIHLSFIIMSQVQSGIVSVCNSKSVMVVLCSLWGKELPGKQSARKQPAGA
ncbi:hypothetical protein VFPPC_17400 [Pochonia chlamydosporia 170]|uniref:Uncharacterized protein n=1 Tax=Pochonia chlamydosporia 170 TaxID=1380566 RepID=A0A219ARP7_METCM|nr:hypothetical protein VFPPC_17400 [Pochonia chlamydosporia 170]OWT43451.1 hypothetical protein VFPPC_17400 [Pochonia chlamydosporia 170]